jgi:hypothetical protein
MIAGKTPEECRALIIRAGKRLGERRRPFVPNEAELRDGLVHIKLTKGKVAVIDARDYFAIGLFRWVYSESVPGFGYASTSVMGKAVRMHTAVGSLCGITGLIDHRNRDTLDNTRMNLRPATRRQNVSNRGPCGSCRFKGVRWDKGARKWRVAVASKHVGLYSTAEEGAMAYDVAAREVFGEFAYLNFPPEHSPAVQSGN